MVQGDSVWLWLAEHQARKTRDEIPGADERDGARQRAGRGEDAEADQNLPQPRKHPQRLGREFPQHHGEQRAGGADGEELLDRLIDHRIGKAGMMPARARLHLDPDHRGGDRGSRRPHREKDERLRGRIFEPDVLRERGDQRQTAGGGDRRRAITAKRRAGAIWLRMAKMSARALSRSRMVLSLYNAKYTRMQRKRKPVCLTG